MKVSDFIDDLAFSKRRTLSVLGVKLPWPFPVAYALGSSSAMVFGRSVYGANAGPVIRSIYGIFRRIESVKYWFLYRYHPNHRYHLIDTGLGYGYHERDDQLLHGAIACLKGYIEDCKLSGCHDPGDEAREIMHWWTVTRPSDQAQHDSWMKELYSGKRLQTKQSESHPLLHEIVFERLSDDDEAKQNAMWALDEKMRDDETKFLHKLVDIRPSMWT